LPAFLNMRHRRSIGDLVDAGEDISPSMLSETLYVDPRGPHVLLAPEHGERGEDVTARVARRVLNALRSRYELVVVDCGATMNEATAMAVEMADTAIVTVTPDVPSTRGAQRLVAMWHRLQVRAQEEVVTLVTRHSRRNEIQPDFLRHLLNTTVLRTAVPASYRRLEPGENNGDPTKVTDEGLRKAFTRLASELDLLNAPAPTGKGGAPTPPGGRRALPDGPSTRDVSGFLDASMSSQGGNGRGPAPTGPRYGGPGPGGFGGSASTIARPARTPGRPVRDHRGVRRSGAVPDAGPGTGVAGRPHRADLHVHLARRRRGCPAGSNHPQRPDK